MPTARCDVLPTSHCLYVPPHVATSGLPPIACTAQRPQPTFCAPRLPAALPGTPTWQASIHFNKLEKVGTYVDCVRWVGDLLLSHGSEGRAVLWAPAALDPQQLRCARPLALDGGGANLPTVLSAFQMRSSSGIWFLRFNMDSERSLLALGNTRGETTVWEVDRSPPRALASFVLPHPKHKMPPAVRHTAVSHDKRYLVCSHDDGTVALWGLPPPSSSGGAAFRSSAVLSAALAAAKPTELAPQPSKGGGAEAALRLTHGAK